MGAPRDDYSQRFRTVHPMARSTQGGGGGRPRPSSRSKTKKKTNRPRAERAWGGPTDRPNALPAPGTRGFAPDEPFPLNPGYARQQYLRQHIRSGSSPQIPGGQGANNMWWQEAPQGIGGLYRTWWPY